MAEEIKNAKKFLDQVALAELIKKIKAADAAVAETAQTNLTTLVGTLGNKTEASEGVEAVAYANVKDYVDTKVTSINNTIGAMDATVRANLTDADAIATGKKVGVKVVEADGVVTGVTVVENDIASADALTKLQAVVGYSALSETSTDATAKSVDARIKAIVTEIGAKNTADMTAEGATSNATGLYAYVDDAAANAVATVVAGADASYDTLLEIANWIKSDTTGAAKMATDIDALQDAVGVASSDAVGTEGEDGYKAAVAATGLFARIEDLEAAVGEGGSVDDQIDDKIEALDAVKFDGVTATTEGETTTYAITEGEKVGVKVEEVDGKIDSVTVYTDDIASAADLSTLAATVGTASVAAVGKEGDEGYKAAVAATGLTARIESLEEMTAYTAAEIDALWDPEEDAE